MSSRIRIAIIGRPNVGKSTLFNRLTGRKRALVHDRPGVTRDRIETNAQWYLHGKAVAVTLVDTGGLGGEHFEQEIREQVATAVDHADVILAVFDAQSGLMPEDMEITRELAKKGLLGRIPVIGTINKVDAESHELLESEFHATGIDHIATVSAEHGRGIDALKELLWDLVPDKTRQNALETAAGQDEIEESVPRIAIIGKPNAGKSTLANALLGSNRMITSPIAGTTVDAVDVTAVLPGGIRAVLVDTAGIRRKSRTEQGIEVLSVVQARKTIERCDVAVLMIDAVHGVTDQDEKIGGLLDEAGCGVIVAVNKWDTQKKPDSPDMETAADIVRERMGFLRYAPVIFISATRNEGLEEIGSLAVEILEQRKTRIPTHEFTEWIREESGVHNPRNAKFYMCHQSGRNPPTFVCHVSDPEKVHYSLKGHLVNSMRKRWGFMGNPIRLLFVSAGQGKKKRATR
ncbi:MAG: ribosome biogenesis GTPase Der [Bdellovibrionales bacterium RIFOXYD1_FULL_53_11]|nr:MAG: ribosome biogenesis GTPase Der [Bdellovibrionales bacterium RIFOXYD1_FULL_53_11]